jgi:DNA-binding NarL/FixJ family response regulator
MSDTQPLAVVSDGDPRMRGLVSRLAAACGFEVAAELDLAVGAVGVSKLVQPTVVVLDVSAPALPELRAIPHLRQVAPDAEIVVRAAYETVRPAALRAGATEVVDRDDMVALQKALQTIAASGEVPDDTGR